MQLKDFQSKAIAEVKTKVNELRLIDSAVQTRLTLMSACGTGKTLMLSNILDESFEDTIALVVTPGKGDLARQTYHSLRKNSERNIILVDETTDLNKVTAGDVLVMNYEKGVVKHAANQKDGLGGQYKSRISRDGEMFNIWNMLAKAHSNHDDVVLVIDEAHYGANSANGQSAIAKFFDSITEAYGRPPMRFELTATPLNFAPDTETVQWVQVNRAKAVAEGLVRINVLLNAVNKDAYTALVEELDGDHELALMEMMYERWKSVKERVTYNPLMLFAVSDANKGGNEEIERILAFLKSKGMTVENGQVSVNMADSKFNTEREHLTKLNSPVSAMLFKTTIAVGWDCPRAQFMMMTRNVSSDNKVFTTQLLGRILRQPTAEAWGDDELDRGYLYAPVGRNFQIPGELSGEVVADSEDIFAADADKMAKVAALNPQAKREKRTGQRTVRSNNGKVGNQVIINPALTDLRLLPKVDWKPIDNQTVSALINADLGDGAPSPVQTSSGTETDVLSNEKLAREQVNRMVLDTLTNSGVRAKARLGQGIMTTMSQWVRDDDSTDHDKPFLTLLSNHDPLTEGVTKLAQVAFEREQKEDRDNFVDGDWSDWMPTSVRTTTSGALRNQYPKSVANASLYGPSLRHSATASELKFEDDVLPMLGDNLKVWARNIRQGGELKEVFSYTYQRINGAFTNTEPDYWTVIEDDSGNEWFVVFEVKGKDFTDGSSDDSRQAKAEAADGYTKKFADQRLAAAAVYKKDTEWMVVTSLKADRQTPNEEPLADWLKARIGLTV